MSVKGMAIRAEREKIIISVGGSLIVPNGGINTTFLKQLNDFIRNQLAQYPQRQFFLVIGGGGTAKEYIEAGHEVIGHELTADDLDWLGIHATRMNAHLVRTIFRDIAHPKIITDYDIIQKASEPVVVAAGYRPGWSTDFCATLLCEDYGVNLVLNLSNISKVYDKDPNKFTDAVPIDTIKWSEFRKLVGDKWIPRMNAPFDPVASKRAEELKIKVIVMSGNDFDNIDAYFQGDDFVGTVIEE